MAPIASVQALYFANPVLHIFVHKESRQYLFLEDSYIISTEGDLDKQSEDSSLNFSTFA
jgi:hypothetical protein